jgi:hypothetical protein
MSIISRDAPCGLTDKQLVAGENVLLYKRINSFFLILYVYVAFIICSIYKPTIMHEKAVSLIKNNFYTVKRHK